VAELERTGRLRAQAVLVVPDVVRRVGLVSSPNTAGRADILEILNASALASEVIEAQAIMSGPAAPGEVAQAIRTLETFGVELIVVARGGGAKSDLAAWGQPPGGPGYHWLSRAAGDGARPCHGSHPG
jgi:exodeoxyribonuclease VII large subunit